MLDRLADLARAGGDGRGGRRRLPRPRRPRTGAGCSSRTCTATGAGGRSAEPLERALGRPVALVNDGHAFALAEARVGAAAARTDVMCIVCGTGIGGGLVLGGRLHLGIDDRAGESGTTPSSSTGRSASAATTAASSCSRRPRHRRARPGGTSFDDALAAARAGDEAALAAIAAPAG